MKTKLFTLVAASVFLTAVACNNEKKKEETTTREEKAAAARTEEAKKTKISVGPDGAEVKTKSGTEIKVDEKGAKAGTKDVQIDIKKDNDQ